MPFELQLPLLPIGYAVSSVRPGESEGLVQATEFTSSEDGQHFIRRLEGFPSEILGRLPVPSPPSSVDNLLVIYRRDRSATAYVNELNLKTTVRVSGPVAKGQLVKKDDISDVEKLDVGVPIPADSGFLFVFSVGWRKGLFYDLSPLIGDAPEDRSFDIPTALGQAYCHVLFQERFSISESEWDQLFVSKWFPFAALADEHVEKLLEHVRANWNPDELTPLIDESVRSKATEMRQSWSKRKSFEPHFEILERALDRYLDRDYISCTAILFPRIEGLLRTYHDSIGMTTSPTQKHLPDSAVSSKIQKAKCLLFPHKFSEYLTKVYFASFTPGASDIDVSRHSVAHGVASAAMFDQKSALLAILVVHQLFYFLEDKDGASPEQTLPASEPH